MLYVQVCMSIQLHEGVPCTLKFTESNMRSRRRVKGLMDSSGMFSNSSAEM